MSDRSEAGGVRAWRVGPVEVAGPLVLAPLAGYTCLPLRLLCRRAGAHLVYTEMVSCQGLAHRNRKTFDLLATCPQEKPVAIQLFGREPGVMAEAVPYLEDAGADIIDINMGCPVPKVVRSEGGAALLSDPDRAVAIAEAVVARAQIPVTCKIRAGVCAGDDSHLALAQRLQEVGVAAIAIHARTVRQGFRGEADHALTRQLVQALRIPVIASGDVFSPTMPQAILQDTGCAAVMIGRGAIGRPWIFTQATATLAGQPVPADPPAGLRLGMALCQAQMMADLSDERTAMHQMRAHLAWYTRGLPGSARLRRKFGQVQTLRQLRELVEEYVAEWVGEAQPSASEALEAEAQDRTCLGAPVSGLQPERVRTTVSSMRTPPQPSM